MKPSLRLQKYLADCGVASRRKAEKLIADGLVSVDGSVVTEMGVKIDPTRQVIRCRGTVVKPKKKYTHILLNKPRGYVTTLSDPHGRPIVTSLVKNVKTRIFPVGRLDIDTEGALILTDDGALAHKILHPRHQTTKTYEAVVKGLVSPDQVRQLEEGIELDGKKTWPASIARPARLKTATRLVITIREGRKRQVRRMFEAVGHPVITLRRIAYGRLRLGSLKSGSYRYLTREDLKKALM